VEQLLVHQQYGEPGITVSDINTEKATGFLAHRFKPDLQPYLMGNLSPRGGEGK